MDPDGIVAGILFCQFLSLVYSVESCVSAAVITSASILTATDNNATPLAHASTSVVVKHFGSQVCGAVASICVKITGMAWWCNS